MRPFNGTPFKDTLFNGIDPRDAGAFIKARRKSLKLTQAQVAQRIGAPNNAYYSTLESGRIDFRRSTKYLAKMLEVLGISSSEAREHLGLDYITLLGDDVQQNNSSLIPAAVRAMGDQAMREFRAEASALVEVPYHKAGAGPNFLEEDEAGTIFVDPEILRRYPNSRWFQIVGDCMEPDYPNGWFAAILPEPGLAEFGSDVLVWFSDDGRSVKRLLQSREDGDHVLYQLRPNVGQTNLLTAPVGSRILGVVVDIQRGGRPKISKRALYDAISEHMPQLLEDEEF